MKVLELEIQDVRGIRHLLLRPDGSNLVVFGPNGSGKSAIVDALDFLLTGRISRFTGSGTAGLTLASHGPHVDRRPEDARVRARIQLDAAPRELEVTRCMSRPKDIECEGGVPPELSALLSEAQQGTHSLCRRDILRYITCEPAARAAQIHALLRLTEMEDIRKCLVKVRGVFEARRKSAADARNRSEALVRSTIGKDEYNRDLLLDFVNLRRQELGGTSIEQATSQNLKSGVQTPPGAGTASKTLRGQATVLPSDFDMLRRAKQLESQRHLAEVDRELRSLLTEVRSDPEALSAVSRLELARRGLPLVDDSGECPLCGAPWPAGELRRHLEEKIQRAEALRTHLDSLDGLVRKFADPVAQTAAALGRIVGAAEAQGRDEDVAVLVAWGRGLRAMSEQLSGALARYAVEPGDDRAAWRLRAPAQLLGPLARLRRALLPGPSLATREQLAWDTLTRLGEDLHSLELADAEFQAADNAFIRARLLADTFEGARDAVLSQLHARISDRFANLYRRVHGTDEGCFAAVLVPDRAGIALTVDFYGRRQQPPNAMHSEGHQDCMGLCLYLALVEALGVPSMRLIVLDDVVMSIDAGHRRGICDVIKDEFRDYQFIITTHDTTWAHQLRTSGVVSSKHMIRLTGWRVETGPRPVHGEIEWEEIEKALSEGEVPEAARKLRPSLEQFFESAAEFLGAQVVYRSDGRWDLGDFMPAATKRLISLLKKATDAAQSWNHRDDMERLRELADDLGGVSARTQAEQWAVNANVHYNNWANMTKNDFGPVWQAFSDMCKMFVCSTCGGMLYVPNKRDPDALRCPCGDVNWNLVRNPAGRC